MRVPPLVVLGIAAGIWIAALALGATGLLEAPELAFFDVLIARRDASAAPRVVVIEVDEADVRRLGHWPMSDRVLADALRRILAAQPRVVGLDVYRDLSVPPGRRELEALLRGDDRVISVYSFGPEGTGPPGVLAGTERVGFNDIVIDRDGTVRRGLLFMDDGAGPVHTAFALRLAQRYLEREGVSATADSRHPDWMRLGPAPLRPFAGDDGGYAGEDDAGYQVLWGGCRGRRAFPMLRLGELLDATAPPGLLRDRVVLLGVTARSIPDLFDTPCGKGWAGVRGVEVQAHAASALIDLGLGESAPLRTASGPLEALMAGLLALAGASVGSRTLRPLVFLGAALGGLGLVWLGAAAALRGAFWIPVATSSLSWTGALVTASAVGAARARTERGQIMRLLSQHVSHEVADTLWEGQRDGRALGPTALVGAVLFVDMRGFSRDSGQLDPGSLMQWLNQVMGVLADAVAAHGGWVEDYFGDGLKANFGPPLVREPEEIARDARASVAAALAMVERVREMRHPDASGAGTTRVGIRIGLHTGPLVAGNLGSASRQKYTTVGETVVVASRLESLDDPDLDPPPGESRILASAEVVRHLGESPLPRRRSVGSRPLKGLPAPLEVWRIDPGV